LTSTQKEVEGRSKDRQGKQNDELEDYMSLVLQGRRVRRECYQIELESNRRPNHDRP
jgi:hypothetical protein